MSDQTTDRREKRLAQIMDRCRHFSGIQHDTCEAGVPYDSVKDVSQRPYAWPCFAKDCATTTCAKVSRPSREEAEAEAEESRRRIERVVKARTAIVERHGDARGLVGGMPCPNECGGTLRYSIAGVNGHIHGTCSTKGCAAWME